MQHAENITFPPVKVNKWNGGEKRKREKETKKRGEEEEMNSRYEKQAQPEEVTEKLFENVRSGLVPQMEGFSPALRGGLPRAHRMDYLDGAPSNLPTIEPLPGSTGINYRAYAEPCCVIMIPRGPIMTPCDSK